MPTFCHGCIQYPSNPTDWSIWGEPWKKQLGQEQSEKQKNPGGLQGRSVNLKERILLKILSYIQAICFYKNIGLHLWAYGLNIKTAICFKLQISKSVGLQELILAVPRHSEGARIGRIWLIDRFSLARKPLPETRICDSPRLLTSNTKCGNLEEVLWVDVFCVGYFFFLNPSFYNPGQKTKSQM